MRLFRRDDAEVIAIGAFALRSQCISLVVLPVSVMANMLFQSIGKYWTATFLSSARQGIFFLPLIAILPKFLGLTGVQITQMCADLLTVLCCIPFLLLFFRDLKRQETNGMQLRAAHDIKKMVERGAVPFHIFSEL